MSVTVLCGEERVGCISRVWGRMDGQQQPCVGESGWSATVVCRGGLMVCNCCVWGRVDGLQWLCGGGWMVCNSCA